MMSRIKMGSQKNKNLQRQETEQKQLRRKIKEINPRLALGIEASEGGPESCLLRDNAY